MKEKIRQTIMHPLISGSAIILLGTNLGNIFNLLFNLFMVRNLSSVDFGVLISLISIITLFAYAADSITPFVVNFAAIYFATDDLGKAKSLFIKVTKMVTLAGFLALILFTLFAPVIGGFLKIENNVLLYTTGVCIFFGFVGIVNKAFLQAKLAFKFIAGVVFIGSFLKFSTGAWLVHDGLGVLGALFAFIIAFIVPYLLTFFPLRPLLSRHLRKEGLAIRKMLKFGFGAIAAIFALTAFITTDILLIKHFFTPDEAGLYGGISVVGKVIYYLSAPIGTVMFPLIVRKFAKKENYHNDFRLALFLVFLPSFLLTLSYFIFPEFIIKSVIDRDEYLVGIPYIGFIGIFFSIYGLIYVMTNFFLSIQKTQVYLPILLFAIAQGFGIWLFHNSLMQVIVVNIVTSGLLLITLLLYYMRLSHRADEISGI